MQTQTHQNVAVIGASDKPQRYAYKVIEKLLAAGYSVFPVHPKLKIILGLPVFETIEQIPVPIHTATLYVGSDRSGTLIDGLLSTYPQRVIFNPGAENPTLENKLKDAGIQTMEACTLVLLSTHQF